MIKVYNMSFMAFPLSTTGRPTGESSLPSGLAHRTPTYPFPPSVAETPRGGSAQALRGVGEAALHRLHRPTALQLRPRGELASTAEAEADMCGKRGADQTGECGHRGVLLGWGSWRFYTQLYSTVFFGGRDAS